MRDRTVFGTCVLLLGILAAAAVAYAGEYDSGYNSGDSDTETIGSDPNTGGATPEDYQNMESIQQQIQDQKDTYGSAGSQEDAVEAGEDNDAEDGH
jgi:hypothetical protein